MNKIGKIVKILGLSFLIGDGLLADSQAFDKVAEGGAAAVGAVLEATKKFITTYYHNKTEYQAALENINYERDRNGYCPLVPTKDLADIVFCKKFTYGHGIYASDYVNNPDNKNKLCGKAKLYNTVKTRKSAQAKAAFAKMALGGKVKVDPETTKGLNSQLVYGTISENPRQGAEGKQVRGAVWTNPELRNAREKGCEYNFTVANARIKFHLTRIGDASHAPAVVPPKESDYTVSTVNTCDNDARSHIKFFTDKGKVKSGIVPPEKRGKYWAEMKKCCAHHKQGYENGQNKCSGTPVQPEAVQSGPVQKKPDRPQSKPVTTK